MFEETRKWLLTVALKKVLRHYTPAMLAFVSGSIASWSMGWVVYSHGYVVVNVEEGLQYLAVILAGLAIGGGVVDNKVKFDKRVER
jgi:hypothetical protein